MMIKKSIHKWCTIVLLGAFVLAPFVAWAHTAQDPEVSPLIAGQDFDNPVGKVFIWNDEENLYVKYQINPPWYMTETAVNVDTAPPSPPIKPGHFTSKHSEENPPPPDNPEDLHTISLSKLGVGPGVLVYIMAHAVVNNLDTGVSGETAWKQGTEIEGPGAGWAMYNEYLIQEVEVPWVEVSISETHLIWDVFKPGKYMALGPVWRIASNSGIILLYGTGGPHSALGPAVRKRSLLPKTPSNPGTPLDEIRLWATCLWGQPSSPHIGDPELVPPDYRISTNPEDLFSCWIDFIHLNGYQMELPKSEKLKNGIAFSLYNMINVDPCASEGRYFEQFVITISVEL